MFHPKLFWKISLLCEREGQKATAKALSLTRKRATKESRDPVIASRSEAIQSFLSGLPRGFSPSQ